MRHLDYTEQENWRQPDDTAYQSPIDIATQSVQPQETGQLEISFQDKVQYDDREIGEQFLVHGQLRLDNQIWELERFHFHDGAEHLVNGQRHDVETHFVFQHEDQTLVLASFGDVSANVTTGAVQNIYDNQVNSATLMHLVPDNHSYFHYVGSLTTPPLRHDIQWLVLTEPVAISAEDKAVLHDHYPDNYREIQEINERVITYYNDKN
ncbi:carbonic anhydrase family protein [Leuconostoc falkenbergense]|uniref:carbonic anhydrase family protein n=1 Tax=Leuconostoc falkenbergense TaxID=2766470 RepID=UPI0024A7B009|nr:carbonic anhydrase family protein [Leuconostoc falkenbergense]MDI6553897.1 carbonic anhydrase family protein [Leuconostoc falkenbergense]